MHEVVACIFYRDEVDRQAEASIGVCHAGGLVEGNKIVFFSVDEQQRRILLGDVNDGTGFPVELGFFFLCRERASR